MCYDIAFTVNVRRLSDYFPDLIYDSQLNLDFGDLDHIQGAGIFPDYPVIYRDKKDGKLHCRPMSWSCIDEDATEMPTIAERSMRLNIRSEKVWGNKKSYWHRIREARCLVPVTGIYEHKDVGKAKKIPYHIKPAGQEIFFIPGLYAVSRFAETRGADNEFWSFGIMTTDSTSNEVLKNIHNSRPEDPRMVLLLPLEMSKRFISDDLSEEEYKSILNYKITAGEIDHHSVYTIRTPKPRPDGKRKNEYFDWMLGDQSKLF